MPNSVNNIGKERAENICRFIREIADQWHLRSLAVLPRDRAPFVPYFAEAIDQGEWDIRIYFNYFFLIEPEDIPPELLLKGEDDPRLFNEDYLSQVAATIKEKLGMKNLDLNSTDKNVLRIILRLLSDPEKCRKAKQFLLVHELSHLFYKHQGKFPEEIKKGVLQRNIQSVALGVLFGIAIKSITVSSLCGLGMGGSVFAITALILNGLHQAWVSRQQEKEADLKAVETVGSEGGLYFFEAMRRHMASFSKNPSSSLIQSLMVRLTYSSCGDFRLNQFVSHPNPSERIDYLKSAKKQA